LDTGHINRFATSSFIRCVVVWTSQPVVFLLVWIPNFECVTPRNKRVRALIPGHCSAHTLRGSRAHGRDLRLARGGDNGDIQGDHSSVPILDSISHLAVISLHPLNNFFILQRTVRYRHLATVHITHPNFVLCHWVRFPFSVAILLDPVNAIYNLFGPSELHFRPWGAGRHLEILGDKSVIPHLENLFLISTLGIAHQLALGNRNLDANLIGFCLANFATPVTTNFFWSFNPFPWQPLMNFDTTIILIMMISPR